MYLILLFWVLRGLFQGIRSARTSVLDWSTVHIFLWPDQTGKHNFSSLKTSKFFLDLLWQLAWWIHTSSVILLPLNVMNHPILYMDFSCLWDISANCSTLITGLRRRPCQQVFKQEAWPCVPTDVMSITRKDFTCTFSRVWSTSPVHQESVTNAVCVIWSPAHASCLSSHMQGGLPATCWFL